MLADRRCESLSSPTTSARGRFGPWLLLVAIAGCHATVASVSPRDDLPAKLLLPDSFSVSQTVWPETVRTQGSLGPDERAVVGAKVSGRVAETLIEFGEVVTQGQPLIRLELADFDLQVDRAEAQLAEACAAVGLTSTDAAQQLEAKSIPFVAVEKAIWDEAQEALDRLIQLRKRDAVSQSEFDKQTALVRVASARYDEALRSVEEKVALIRSRRTELAQAKQAREDATIRAPFDGVISERHLAKGMFVQLGAAVVTLVRVDPLRFQARVPERKATSIKVGQPMHIYIEGETQPVAAAVVRVSPSLDLASRSLQIEAEIPNPDFRFRTGLFAEGYVEVDSAAKTIAIPPSALGEFAGVYKAYVVAADGILESRPVQIGRQQEDRIEVVSGLEVGDQIVRSFVDGAGGAPAALVNNE